MARYTVEKGMRYKAKISLGLLQSVASNDMVAARLCEAGFTDVTVAGSGRARTAEGLWPHKNTSAEIPSEITSIKAIA